MLKQGGPTWTSSCTHRHCAQGGRDRRLNQDSGATVLWTEGAWVRRFQMLGTKPTAGACARRPVPEGRGRARRVRYLRRGLGHANEHPRRGAGGDSGARYVGRLIAKELKGQKVKRPFRYFDNGNMTVGKNYAVLERRWLRAAALNHADRK